MGEARHRRARLFDFGIVDVRRHPRVESAQVLMRGFAIVDALGRRPVTQRLVVVDESDGHFLVYPELPGYRAQPLIHAVS